MALPGWGDARSKGRLRGQYLARLGRLSAQIRDLSEKRWTEERDLTAAELEDLEMLYRDQEEYGELYVACR